MVWAQNLTFLLRDVARIALVAEADGAFTESPANDIGQAHERAAADKEDVGRVDLDVLLFRVLAPSLRWDVGGRALQHFQQRLLHALAGGHLS